MIAVNVQWWTSWQGWLIMLWAIILPIILVYALIQWIIDRIKK